MKTLLVPTDFSANAANAIAFAVQLLNQLRGKLILVHAVDSQILGLPEEGGTINPEVFLKNGYLEELNKISRTLRLENGFRFEVETICESTPLSTCIANAVAAHKVDLIVMGTRGASNFLDKLLGTNTWAVMEETTCPVLAIPAKATYKGFKYITYASDFEKEESNNLRQLFHIAEPLNAEVQVLNVKTEDQLNLVPDEQIIAEIAQEYKARPFKISQIKARNVVEGIKAFTKANQVDVVAVALQKHNVWETLFNSSVTSQLAFESTLPLLALPLPASQQPATGKQRSENRELAPNSFSFLF
ncbi:universal stress protein [Rufibacter roseus]|uniref:Universal stress protein n=1 Tax=Rufibacter roseus TaxID=1567108 RepID=A0ABW2DP99_9BACT|nr:universal stress protein [Rufibacter roseus]